MSDVSGAASGAVVVTGGTGFIGWALCAALRDAGEEVRAVVRPSSRNPLPPGVRRVDAELDPEAMASAVAGAKVVYHLAGLTRARNYAEFERVNAAGAAAAAGAASRAGAAFLLVSSQAAAGTGTLARPRREEDPPLPVSDYGRSKLAGELAVAAVEGLRYAIVRPPGVYGPRDRDFLMLFQAAARGLVPRIGARNKAYTFVHVDDAVDALCAVAASLLGDNSDAMGETFFIGHPDTVTQGELIAALAANSGRSVREVGVPVAAVRLLAEFGELRGKLLGRPGLLNRNRFREIVAEGFVCSVDKIASRVGWTAKIDLAEGIADTARWYVDHGWM